MTEIPPPPSTGAHPAQPPPESPWASSLRSLLVTVIAALAISGIGAAVTWGVLQTRVDVIEADVERLREQATAARAQTNADVTQLQVQQAVSARDDQAMKDLWVEINRRLGRIEDRLDESHRRRSR